MSIFLEALEVASEAHKDQKRRDGLPYIVHPMHVVSLLMEHDVIDEEILSAAILHDVVEDCGVTLLQIEQQFGARIAGLVAELTHKSGSKVESFKKMSPDARLVKLADRTSNISSMHRAGWSDEKRRAYAMDASQMVAQVSKSDATATLRDLASTLTDVVARTNSLL